MIGDVGTRNAQWEPVAAAEATGAEAESRAAAGRGMLAGCHRVFSTLYLSSGLLKRTSGKHSLLPLLHNATASEPAAEEHVGERVGRDFSIDHIMPPDCGVPTARF